MFPFDEKQRRILSRWIIGIVSVCVLVYLGVRHVSQIASEVRYVFSLIAPLCILESRVPHLFKHLFKLTLD